MHKWVPSFSCSLQILFWHTRSVVTCELAVNASYALKAVVYASLNSTAIHALHFLHIAMFYSLFVGTLTRVQSLLSAVPALIR